MLAKYDKLNFDLSCFLWFYFLGLIRACSSMVERLSYTQMAVGSNPTGRN